MATFDRKNTKCKNKLCDYEGSINVIVGCNSVKLASRVCPKCGFKTLAVGVEVFNDERVRGEFAEQIKDLLG